MNRQRIKLFLMSLLLVAANLSAQVVQSVPQFPTINDSVVVIFNAKEGDGGLAGFTGDVYAHTGVITEESVGSHDWKYVIGNWGDNNLQPQLTSIGEDLWTLDIGNIREFYGIPESEKVLKLAFVFRSANTQRTGRDVGGTDIFLDLFEPGLNVVVLEPRIDVSFGDPLRSPAFVGVDDTLQIAATSAAVGTQLSTMILVIEDEQVSQTEEDTLRFEFIATNYGPGVKSIKVVASDTAGVADSTDFVVMVNPAVVNADVPAGIRDGINYVDNSTVTLSLFAPHKEFIYIIGDFNDWKVDSGFFMNRHEVTQDSVRFWLTISGLNPDLEFAFQYLVDGHIRIADPYAEKLLDSVNDQFIDSETYPNLRPYPMGKTNHLVSTFKINEEGYQWQASNFQRPEPHDLVIYELLVRDFIDAHNYNTLVDTLDYLQRLGVNAIELMPVMEFEGNESWGYNPALYFAPDKYYGTKNALKRFIDECHKRGMAVILDMVLNHSFGQSPFVRLYSSGEFGPPTPENPWYNVEARHPFNVGYDFNHETSATKALVDRVNAFWLTEYKVDGFRFDLSKGFTQKFSGNNVGLWSEYDPSRIALLTRMANQIWEVDSSAYVILEHFADNEEEKVLSDRGMLLWGNMNGAYSQSAMGWLADASRSSDLSGGYYKNRGWSKPHLVTYMESHDEPWLMYKNLQFGRSSDDGSYDVKQLSTALERIKLVGTFFLTIPGPKMMWQFGELGYDQFLPETGFERTAPKPILWEYYQDEERRLLYKFYRELLKLRRENEAFRSPETSVNMSVGQGQYGRRIQLSHPSVNVIIVGNFDVIPRKVDPNFFHGGTWYDYFFADSLDITSSFDGVMLKPGGFRLYTDKNIGFAEEILITSVKEDGASLPENFALYQNFPNPFNPETAIRFEVPKQTHVKIVLYNIIGQRIRTLVDDIRTAGEHTMQWDGLNEFGAEVSSGIYVLRMTAGEFVKSHKLVKLK